MEVQEPKLVKGMASYIESPLERGVKIIWPSGPGPPPIHYSGVCTCLSSATLPSIDPVYGGLDVLSATGNAFGWDPGAGWLHISGNLCTVEADIYTEVDHGTDLSAWLQIRDWLGTVPPMGGLICEGGPGVATLGSPGYEHFSIGSIPTSPTPATVTAWWRGEGGGLGFARNYPGVITFVVT